MILIYHFLAILLGYIIYRKYLYFACNYLTQIVVSVVIGLLISLPATYLLSILFIKTANPLGFGLCAYIIVILIFVYLNKALPLNILKNFKSLKISKNVMLELFVILISLFISTYIMDKSFKSAGDGTLLVARNAVFDFGHNLAILRSMSWGSNLPYTSPFVSGTVHIYHFMFQFWSALIESVGNSITIAVNIPSILSFWIYLMTLYVLSKEIFGSKVVGFISIIFATFHSGLMFVSYLQKYGLNFNTLWNLPNYMFAGPTDGSVYSLFFSLNVFVNQRHLGIALSAFLIIYFLFYKNITRSKISKSSLFLLCLLTATFFLWHVVLWLGLVFVVVCMIFLSKKYKLGILVTSIIITLTFLIISPWTPSIYRMLIESLSGGDLSQSYNYALPNYNVLQFGIYNFGLLGVLFGYGLWISKRKIKFFTPIMILLGFFILRSISNGLIDQKYLSLLLVVGFLFSSHGFVSLFFKKKIYSIILILLFPLIIASGLIDFMVIKNDYLYPVKITQKDGIVEKIFSNTNKDDVVYSFPNIFDPVLLAGRKNYLGFFQQPSGFLSEVDKYRKDRIQNIFDASESETFRFAVADLPVEYILLPKNQPTDIQYTIDFNLFRQTLEDVYEDDNYILFSTKNIN